MSTHYDITDKRNDISFEGIDLHTCRYAMYVYLHSCFCVTNSTTYEL